MLVHGWRCFLLAENNKKGCMTAYQQPAPPPSTLWCMNLLEPDGAWGSQRKTIPNTANIAKRSGCKAEELPSRLDSRLSSSAWACACQHLNGSSGISTEHRTLGACISASCSWAVAHGNALLSTPCSQLSVHHLTHSFIHSFFHLFVRSLLRSLICSVLRQFVDIFHHSCINLPL